MNKNKNIAYLDLANVISAIAVVILHANASFWHFSATGNYWPRANVIECLFYFCVPIFFMISGITLIDYNKRYSLKEYFKKRISKVFIPYVFWSFFAIAYNIFFIGSIKTYDVTWTLIINKLLSGTGMEIYWFFIPLFLIYLIIPLFSMIDDKQKRIIFLYFTTICFIFNALVPFILGILNPDIKPLNIGIEAKCLIYIGLGYLIHNCRIKQNLKHMFYFLALASLLVHIIGTYILSMDANRIILTYKGFTNVPGILYATGIFLFLKENGEKIMHNKIVYTIVTFLRKYTFGIYLLHIYILRTILKLYIVDAGSWQWVTIMPFVAIIASILITMIFKKIPILNKLIP